MGYEGYVEEKRNTKTRLCKSTNELCKLLFFEEMMWKTEQYRKQPVTNLQVEEQVRKILFTADWRNPSVTGTYADSVFFPKQQ